MKALGLLAAPFALLANRQASKTTTTSSSETKSLKELSQYFTELYNDLSQAPIYKQATPTIKLSFVNPDGGWRSPKIDPPLKDDEDENYLEAVASRFGKDKPLALFLPGLDCAGISASQQFDELGSRFELWRLSVTPDDRTSYRELSGHVGRFIEEVASARGKDITIIGESFGGLLALSTFLSVKARARKEMRENPIKGLVIINPATSYEETSWDVLGPTLSLLRFFEQDGASQKGATPYTILGGAVLASLVPDRRQLSNILSLVLDAITGSSTTSPMEALGLFNKGFASLGTRLPAELISHRVGNWLSIGSSVVNSRLNEIDVPTLVVAGEEDTFLPSKQEAARLVDTLSSCEKLLVPGAGHFVLDDRVNLTEAILYSNIDPVGLVAAAKAEDERYDAVKDWKLPSDEEVQSVIDNEIKRFRQLASPVFFSTDKNSKRWLGLGQVPSEGPLVFVGNHQLLGLDLGMVIAELIEQRGIVARGLAHPVVTSGVGSPNNHRPRTPGLRRENNNAATNLFDPSTFQKFGAVMVTPRNYYKLLQTGQNALLFPGGVREVFHGKNEAYQLFWPEEVDFVRTAARFNATIIPLSAVGAADSVNVLMDAPDVAKLPFVGERVLQSSANTTAARWNQENEEELFTPPLVAPSIPARHYFVFGAPIKTVNVNHKDAEACRLVYDETKRELERGLADVLRARDHDPFKNTPSRLAYERITGKSAPTFEVDELNRR